MSISNTNIDSYSAGIVYLNNPDEEMLSYTIHFPLYHNVRSLEIGFNYKYLHDAVSRCEGEEIELKMNSPFNPLIINSTDDDSYLFMVLPVRI